MPKVYYHEVQIYYEDTDHSGVVYHANYLKYFERAREHVIDSKTLADLWREKGLGFVVYKANMIFHDGAEFGEVCEVRTTCEIEGKYKTLWRQEFWRPGGKKPAVAGEIEMVCVDKNKQLQPTPSEVLVF